MIKIALITGGAKGIGRAICESFNKSGYKVYFVDHDRGAGKELSKKLHGSVFILCDVGDRESVRHAVEKVVDAEGHIDVLVNNAGITRKQDFLSDDAIEAFEKVIRVNLHSTFLFSHYAAKHMKDGAIVNIASTRALQSEKNTEGYSASKGAILALTHAMAISLSDRRIRVNAISPGWIDVQNYQSVKAEIESEEHAKPAKITSKDKAQHPVGRVGEPKDIASMALFLADSSQSGFITGQNFVVDGGMTKKMIYV